jgi:hypothetical protein
MLFYGDKSRSLALTRIFFDTAFKYADGENFVGYFETNEEPVCVNSVTAQCHISANYLTSF